MRYRIRHATTYTYEDPVDLASHVLHLLPRDLPHNIVINSQLISVPAPTRATEGFDHFGNRTSWLFIDLPHKRFEVTLDATVDVAFPKPPDPRTTPGWEKVVALARLGGPAACGAGEFLFASPKVALDPAARSYVAESFTPGRPVLEGLIDLLARIRRDFTFRAGVTTIATPVSQIMKQRSGVCQDFTHMMIAGLRANGLPARYVSGYIRTRPPPGAAPRRGADQSHAWVGCWLGPDHGWIDLDPTNDLIVQNEHVVLSWGRDFSDVSPLRGIILGGGKHSLRVSVDLEALAPVLDGALDGAGAAPDAA